MRVVVITTITLQDVLSDDENITRCDSLRVSWSRTEKRKLFCCSCFYFCVFLINYLKLDMYEWIHSVCRCAFSSAHRSPASFTPAHWIENIVEKLSGYRCDASCRCRCRRQHNENDGRLIWFTWLFHWFVRPIVCMHKITCIHISSMWISRHVRQGRP